MNLELIRRLIETRRSTDEALRFTQAVRAPYEDEEPQIVDFGGAGRALGHPGPSWRRSLKLGLIRDLGDGALRGAEPADGRAGGRRAGRAR